MKQTRYLLKFSYDGSFFHGFQRQNNVENVQGEIERVLSIIFDEKIIIKGAGRTDAKVHARNQYAHFDVNKKILFLKNKMNKLLLNIKIKSIKIVDDSFHARYSPKFKIYEYKISFDRKSDSNYYLINTKKLDLTNMIKASEYFIGTHNFKNFVAGYRDDYVTTIFDIKFIVKKNYMIIRFKGIGFYRYMVRNLVGALLDVGKGKVDKTVILSMLINYNVEKRLNTAKAEGLYLVNIKY